MKVKGISLGCKVNTYEMEFILSSFKDKGYEISSDSDKADIYVINTCSVTNTSDAKSRKVINRVIRENPDAVIVVMGCMIEANKDYDNNISIIIGNKDKNKVVSLVEEYLNKKEKIKRLYDDFDNAFEDMFITNMPGRTRAFVKIQDGCENFCSYCIIPYTRGKCRSKDKNALLCAFCQIEWRVCPSNGRLGNEGDGRKNLKRTIRLRKGVFGPFFVAD